MLAHATTLAAAVVLHAAGGIYFWYFCWFAITIYLLMLGFTVVLNSTRGEDSLFLLHGWWLCEYMEKGVFVHSLFWLHGWWL